MEFKRSKEKLLGGVCSGIAEFFNVNPLFVRIIWIILTLITFILPGLIVYIILWNTMTLPDK